MMSDFDWKRERKNIRTLHKASDTEKYIYSCIQYRVDQNIESLGLILKN